MESLTLLSTINLESSNRKAVNFLERKGCDNLFLDFPRDQEIHIRSIALGIPPKEVVQQLRDCGLIKDPEDTQKYRAAAPIFDYLSCMSPETGIYCFRDPLYYYLSRKMMGEILVLTYKTKLRGIRVDEWINVFEDEIMLRMRGVEREANIIADRAVGESICLGASKEFIPFLEGKGFTVELIELDRSYSPLDVLRIKLTRSTLQGEEPPRKMVARLVGYHLKFTDLIIDSLNFEKGYQSWKEKYSEEIDEILSM